MSEMSKAFPEGHAVRVVEDRGTLSGRTGTIVTSREFASVVLLDGDDRSRALANAELELGHWEVIAGTSEHVFVPLVDRQA